MEMAIQYYHMEMVEVFHFTMVLTRSGMIHRQHERDRRDGFRNCTDRPYSVVPTWLFDEPDVHIYS